MGSFVQLRFPCSTKFAKCFFGVDWTLEAGI
jgi:hypothetical protein